jgi:hypothetical protein
MPSDIETGGVRLSSAASRPGFTLGELVDTGDRAPPHAGTLVGHLGRLVYRLFVPLDGPADVIAKAVFVWDVYEKPYGSAHTSYLAVRRENDAPVLIPTPGSPDKLRDRPATVRDTRNALHRRTQAVAEAASVGLLAGRMLSAVPGHAPES